MEVIIKGHNLKNTALIIKNSLTIKTVLIFSVLLALSIPAHALMEYADSKEAGKYVRKHFVELLNKPFDESNDKRKAILIGDSHAQDFLNMITEAKRLENYQISTVHIVTQCQPYYGNNLNQFINTKDRRFCENGFSIGKSIDRIKQADLVILAANWKEWAIKQLPVTIKNLALNDQQELLIMGRKNLGKISIRHFLRMPEEKRIAHRNKVDKEQVRLNQLMHKTLKNVKWIDLHKNVCGSTSAIDCPVFTPSGELISFDGGHLTPAGAKYYGDKLTMLSVEK